MSACSDYTETGSEDCPCARAQTVDAEASTKKVLSPGVTDAARRRSVAREV